MKKVFCGLVFFIVSVNLFAQDSPEKDYYLSQILFY